MSRLKSHASKPRHSSMDAGIQSQGCGLNNTLPGTGLRHPCRNDGSDRLLSDEQLEHYATLFMHLNSLYELTAKHHFYFTDFLINPDELAIHRYFANQQLFINRRSGSPILLAMFLTAPDDILEAALVVDCLHREVDGIRAEQPLPRQTVAAQWFEISNLADFHGKNDDRYERKHRVLMRGAVLFEPFTHYFRCERKRAGG